MMPNIPALEKHSRGGAAAAEAQQIRGFARAPGGLTSP
jgi:hypothetical protein